MAADAAPHPRGAALSTYAIAASEREPEFDRIVADAAQVTGAPVAFLGFLDDREWIKAIEGWALSEIPMHASFAARLTTARDVVAIPDASADPQFRSHPLVAGQPFVRFYAGVPIVAPDGHYLGALSVLDRSAHVLTPQQTAALRALGRAVVRELVVRRERRELEAEIAAARESIDESDARFREFFELTDDLIMSIGADGRLLHSNQAVLSSLGYSREEISRAPLVQFIDPEARDAFRDAFAEVFRSGEPHRVETVFMAFDGRRITVEGSLRPKVVDGVPMLARVIFRDISDRKAFEVELGSARDAALEAARLKTQFLTNVSHEIRTPMNGILGMIDLLLSTPLQPDQVEYAHYARASAEQLLSIVNNVLYVSKVEAGSLVPANVEFDLFKMLQRIVEVMKIAVLGKDIDVEFEYQQGLPMIFRGSQPKLRQVITNLMDNAVKFTEEGTIALRVSQQTETDSHHVLRFEVSDTGIGIAPEDRLLLFERFSQVEASSTRRYAGVGLGLATARQLVETMGGLIDVESTPGYGSTFWFTVPFPKAATAGQRPIASSDLEFKGKRVALADRVPGSRKIVAHYLSTWEMPAVELERATDVVDLLRREAGSGNPIRVLIFDDAPDKDGIALAKEIREDPAIARTRLIYLLPPNQEVNLETMRLAGINASVARPVGQGELFDAITAALAHEALDHARSAVLQAAPRPAAAPVGPEQRKSIRVLLAEDNFLNRKLTLSQLEKLGYTAEAVANGQEALEAVQQNRYHVILMDCQMPIVDGYQATMEIRRLEQLGLPRHRIIAMTANALEGDREKCLAAGMDDYLSKPTKHEDLDNAMARYFE